MLKCIIFTVEHLYPGMCHRSGGRNAVDLIGYRTCGACAAADECRSRPCHRPGDPLCSAGAEFQNRSPLRRTADSVGLGRKQALVVELQQHIGFQHLGLYCRGADRYDRLPGKDRCALRDCPEISVKPELSQVIQKSLIEHSSSPQIINVLLVKMQVLYIFDNLLQPGRNREAPAVRNTAEEDVKIGNPVFHACFPIPVPHGELIIITEHREINAVGAFLHPDPPR